jgi:nitroreductase
MLKDLVYKTRSYRRFDQSFPISLEVLRDLVDLARCSASLKNLQPLTFFLSNKPETNELIFPHLSWAGYLTDWPGPVEGERPAAYIFILGDMELSEQINCDHGIAAQSIMLGATEMGLGGCMLSSVRRKPVHEAFRIPERYRILLVLALGKPIEKVVIEQVRPDGDTRYFRDKDQVHYVPKRSLDEIIIS